MKKKILAMLLIASLVTVGCGSAPAATTPDKDLESSKENEKPGKETEKPGNENQTDSQGKAGENGNEDLTEATDSQAGKDIATSGSTQTTSKNDNSSGSSGDTSSAVKPGNTGNNGSAGTGSTGSGTGFAGAGTGSAGSGTGSAGAGTGTGGSSGAGSSGGSNGGGNTGTPSPPPKQDETPHVCNHQWIEITEKVQHEATGHYDTKVVKEAWDEAVYGYRVVCGCGRQFVTVDECCDHIILDNCYPGNYSSKKVIIDTIHHDAETEQVWVVDKAAWTEVVGTGKYKCSICGETK